MGKPPKIFRLFSRKNSIRNAGIPAIPRRTISLGFPILLGGCLVSAGSVLVGSIITGGRISTGSTIVAGSIAAVGGVL